jgi:hypothetical protein
MSSFQEVDEKDVILMEVDVTSPQKVSVSPAPVAVSAPTNHNVADNSTTAAVTGMAPPPQAGFEEDVQTSVPPAFTNRQEGSYAYDGVVEDDYEDRDVSSSIENLIPPHLRADVKKGLGLFYNWASTTVTAVKEKAKAINESDTVKELKQKTVEVAAQAAEVAAPYWEKTVTTVANAAETASEQAVIAAEKMQPTFDKVGN